MSTQGDKSHQWREAVRHPAVRKLADAASLACGVSFAVIHATDGKWGQTRLDGKHASLPEFCRVVQSSPGGANHCRLCHVLMAVAASSGGSVMECCHAGASVYISPSSREGADCMAVVSSCTFAEEDGWENVRARGESLGIDLKVLRKAYHALPRITEERAALLHTFIDALSAALELAEENIALRSAGLKSKEIPRVEDMLESFFKSTEWAGGSSVRMLQDKTEAPLLVRVVCELVLQRPDLPLTVRQLAGAARITPNHFTTLFHKSTGVPFTEFQSEVRITRAKKLLGDLTLNISDVARHVGFADAGYFARRFRQRTGLSPSEWRSRCSQDA